MHQGAARARNVPAGRPRLRHRHANSRRCLVLCPFPFGITPDVLRTSLHLEGSGFGALEKEQDRKARLFREKVEEIEMESWRRAGCPEGSMDKDYKSGGL